MKKIIYVLGLITLVSCSKLSQNKNIDYIYPVSATDELRINRNGKILGDISFSLNSKKENKTKSKQEKYNKIKLWNALLSVVNKFNIKKYDENFMIILNNYNYKKTMIDTVISISIQDTLEQSIEINITNKEKINQKTLNSFKSYLKNSIIEKYLMSI